MTKDLVCPRCRHMIPNDDEPGAYPGALSRADNWTEICSRCGEEEALEQWIPGGRLTPMSDWPLYREEPTTAPPRI